jgi:hypothetical protein
MKDQTSLSQIAEASRQQRRTAATMQNFARQSRTSAVTMVEAAKQMSEIARVAIVKMRAQLAQGHESSHAG